MDEPPAVVVVVAAAAAAAAVSRTDAAAAAAAHEGVVTRDVNGQQLVDDALSLQPAREVLVVRVRLRGGQLQRQLQQTLQLVDDDVGRAPTLQGRPPLAHTPPHPVIIYMTRRFFLNSTHVSKGKAPLTHRCL